MPRKFGNKQVYTVWVSGGSKSKTFTDKAEATAYLNTQSRFNKNVLSQVHKDYSAAANWLTAKDVQFAQLKNRGAILDTTGAMPVPLDSHESKYAQLLAEQKQVYEQSSTSSTCIVYSDCAYTRGETATVGLWSRELGFARTYTLNPKDNHQSGELKGVMMALEHFVSEGMTTQVQYKRLVCISDNEWAIDTMNKYVRAWVKKYGETGRWLTNKKEPVKHAEIIKAMLDLERFIGNKQIAVDYMWIPREENTYADALSRGQTIPPEVYTAPVKVDKTASPKRSEESKPGSPVAVVPVNDPVDV